MASLFDTLQAGAQRAGVTARTKKSQAWFKNNVKNLSISRQALLKDDALERTSRNIRGNMYMYFYDPKHKLTLPYYDRFPLTIMVDSAPGGFYGLNLHYLNYNTRATFLDELMTFGPAQTSESSRLTKLRYNLISSVQKFKEFKPCFKHYLSEHVNSKLLLIEPADWEIAIFLPTESFRKVSKETVWKESRKMF